MSETSDYIKRAAARSGFKREFYLEKKMPTQSSNVYVLPFFGDLRSCFIFSSLVLKNFKDANPDKYLILASWPGMQSFFPYFDEYWTLEDDSLVKILALGTNNVYNEANISTEITKSLAEVVNIITPRDLKKYYNNGFTKEYWEEFGNITRFMPEVPSSTYISNDFKKQLSNRKGTKIVIYPSTRMRSWQEGLTKNLPINQDFWISIVEKLIDEGYDPIVYQNNFTYDISKHFIDRCLYLIPKNMSDLLAAIREIGFLLDVHTGISRLAIAARCPFLAVTERQIYINDKDYELDDLCAESLPRQYIFSFSTQLMVGTLQEWEISVIKNITKRIRDFLPQIDKNNLPSTTSSCETISYSVVRERKNKRLGSAFIKSSKNK